MEAVLVFERFTLRGAVIGTSIALARCMFGEVRHLGWEVAKDVSTDIKTMTAVQH